MSNSGKIWDTREAYVKQRANTWETPGNRGMRLGGQTTPSATNSNTVEFVDMISTGNTADFGDLTSARKKGAAAGGFTRVLCLGGQTPTNVNTIDFVNPTATGNFSDFGDLVNAGQTTNCSHSNNIKTISADGSGDDDGIVITHMASQGNSSTWQNRTAIDTQWSSGTGDNTRFLICGKYPANNQIDSMEIATLGAKADFGNLTRAGWGIATGSNSTRSVFMGGNVTPGTTNVIDFVTTQSAGNATDFGDLTAASFQDAAGASNSKRAIAFGYQINTINTINIATTGNATDFGDTLTSTYYQIMGADNGGGGLPQEGAFPQRPSVTYMPESGRSLVMCGTTPTTDRIDLVFIPTSGATSDFGDAIIATRYTSGSSSKTSGIYAGGGTPSLVNTIAQTKFASFGNASDFGDLSVSRTDGATSQCGSSTRGLFINGITPSGTNVIDYITFATIGNATDFGDSTDTRYAGASLSSPTRGIYAGGAAPSPGVIDYTTIASTGNATDFGDTTAVKGYAAAAASDTRGLVMGGASPSVVATIDYITIASTGNAQDFGDLSVARSGSSGTSNNIRGMAYTGRTPSITASIDFVTIATLGNGTDYGDLSLAREYPATGSDSHGGLQSS